MRTRAWSICITSLAMLATLGLVSCADKAPAPAGDTAEAETAAPVEVGPEVLAVLARADLADGTEDHIVSKCPGCSLAMEGDPEQAVQVGDYALHFCSDGCREQFEEGPADALLALELPEERGTEATP